jgi:hypothetical protein
LQATADDAPAGAAPARRQRGSAKFRFWHDERRFKGASDKCIVQQALFDAGALRQLQHVMRAAVSSADHVSKAV